MRDKTDAVKPVVLKRRTPRLCNAKAGRGKARNGALEPGPIGVSLSLQAPL